MPHRNNHTAIFRLFQKRLAKYAHTDRFRYEKRIQSMSDLLKITLQVTLGLERKDIPRNSKVVVCVANPLDILGVVPALWKKNITPVLRTTTLTSFELQSLLGATTPVAIVVDAQAQRVVDEIDLSEYGSPVVMPYRELTDGMVNQFMEIADLPVGLSGDAALVHFSSGSTGVAKGIERSFSEILEEAEALASRIPLSSSDTVVFAAPICHSFASGFLFAALFAGARIVFETPGRIEGFVDRMNRVGATVLVGVPYLFQGLVLLESSRSTHLELPLRAFCGGCPIDSRIPSILHKQYGILLSQEYGLSEVGVVTLNTENALKKPESVGRAIPGLVVSIVDANGELISSGNLGEVRISSVNSKISIVTGDLGYLDREGDLYLCGRKKLLINVGGNKVDPFVVEKVLMQSGLISSCVVFPMKDRIHGERPTAVIVPTRMPLKRRDLIEYCRRHLSEFKVPRTVFLSKQLRRTPSLKLDRNFYAHYGQRSANVEELGGLIDACLLSSGVSEVSDHG